MTDIIRNTRETALGDTIVTRSFFTEGRLVREDITISGPAELLSQSTDNHHGKSWYTAESRPARERRGIWLDDGRAL